MCVPASATVAVVSKGDKDLIRFGGPRGGTSLRRLTDAISATTQSTTRRTGGAGRHTSSWRELPTLPTTAGWWLDHYPAFAVFLTHSCRLVLRRDDTGVLYSLPPVKDWSLTLEDTESEADDTVFVL